MVAKGKYMQKVEKSFKKTIIDVIVNMFFFVFLLNDANMD